MKSAEEIIQFVDAYINGHAKIMETLIKQDRLHDCKHIQHTIELLKAIKQYAEDDPNEPSICTPCGQPQEECLCYD